MIIRSIFQKLREWVDVWSAWGLVIAILLMVAAIVMVVLLQPLPLDIAP